MTFAAKMICSERAGRRLEVDIDATLRRGSVHQVDVEIRDISVSGFLMSTSVDLSDGELLTIGLGGLGMQPAVVVRRTLGQYGCQFVNKVSQSYVDRLRFDKPNTLIPFVAPTAKGEEDSGLSDAGSRLPILVRVAIILMLGAVSWVIFLKAFATLFQL